ncbi:MAG: peptidylprolyl isomerase [Bdellovibrionales bacterium]|nr:peptidylprolyl isomerase [Bdellovibrionales bacterium]
MNPFRMISAVVFGLSILATSAFAATEVAKVNGKSISDQDVKAALASVSDAQRSAILKDAQAKRNVLQGIIDQEIMLQEAEKLKIDQSQAYKDALAAFRKQYLMAQVLEKSVAPKVTESGAKRFYESNKQNFSTDRVHVQHILVTDELQAKDILSKAKEKDADFMALAEKFSKDPSAKNNRGDIGPINRDSPFVAEFKNAAFNGKKGEIIGPVKTAFGYHVIKVVDKYVGRALNYDEVELQVKTAFREGLIRELVGQLKSQAKVQINDKALNSL